MGFLDALTGMFSGSFNGSTGYGQSANSGYGISGNSGYGMSNGFTNGSAATAENLAMWQMAQAANAQEAEKARQWSEYMSNTAYQRAVRDLALSHLNPILAYTNGPASTPGASSASTAATHAVADTYSNSYNQNNGWSYNENSGWSYYQNEAGLANGLEQIGQAAEGLFDGLNNILEEIGNGYKEWLDELKETNPEAWRYHQWKRKQILPQERFKPEDKRKPEQAKNNTRRA